MYDWKFLGKRNEKEREFRKMRLREKLKRRSSKTYIAHGETI